MDKFTEVGMKIAAQRHLSAIKDGLLSTLPVTLAGSVFLMFRFLPIPNWNGILESIFGANYSAILSYPVAASFDLVGLIALIAISYRLAESYEVNPVAAAVSALCGYFSLAPNFIMYNVAGLEEAVRVSGAWGVSYTSSQSLFVVLLVSIGATEIYRAIIQRGITIKLPDMVPPNISGQFAAIIPTFVILVIMWVLRIVVEMTHFGTVHNLINTTIQTPLLKLGGSFFGFSVIIFIKDLLWTVGIHGPNIMNPIMNPIEFFFRDANRLAFEAGEALPYIFNSPFRAILLQLGGSGNTFMFTVMCAFIAKSQQLKQIGKLALGPALFNINEPIIFGVPVVLNPIMMIPFLLAPFTSLLISYIGMSTGLVARLPGIDIPWTTPPLISGFLASGGKISVVLLQVVILAVTALIYYPFFKIMDKKALDEENGTQQ